MIRALAALLGLFLLIAAAWSGAEVGPGSGFSLLQRASALGMQVGPVVVGGFF